MKSLLSILVVLIIISSCRKQPPALNENFISVNKCQSFTKEGNTITCCVDSVIQDSRCPIGAMCIWQGIAVGRFLVKSNNENHVITLATSEFPPYTRDTIVAGYKIEFINLLPQKEISKSFNYDDYIAEVKVTKP
ncbi:MAG: hypothetical protein ABIN01_11380 [Ferruginibacter sp.]